MAGSKMRIVLVASLALNVFAVGFAATLWMRPAPAALLNPNPVALGQRVADMLPEPAKAQLLLRLEAIKPVIEDRLGVYSDVLVEIANLLDKDVIDQNALAAAIARARSARADIGDQLTDAFVATVSELPREVRQQLVRRYFGR